MRTSLIPLCALLFVLSVRGEPRTVRVGSSVQNHFAYPGADGKPTGFFPDVLQEAARRAGVRVLWVFLEDRVENVVDRGMVDVYAAAYRSPDREQRYHVTRGWWPETLHVVTRGDGEVDDIDGLRRRSLLYWQRPVLTPPLHQLFPETELLELQDPEQRLVSVCGKRADAALFPQGELVLLRDNWPAACQGVDLRLLPFNGTRLELAIIAPKAQAALADQLRDQIDAMTVDGTLTRLVRKHRMWVLPADAFAVRDGVMGNVPWIAWIALGGSLLVVLAGMCGYLIRTRQELARVRKAKEEFLAMLSHEIRTPMNSVVGYIDLLHESPLTPEQKSLARDVSGSAMSLLRLLNDVMQYSRIRSGQVTELRREEFCLLELVDETCSAVALAADTKDIEFVVRVSERTPERVWGDPVALRQILTNLLMNAVKFTHSGYVKLSVDYRDGTLEAVVADTGVGIPGDKLQTIFEAYRQVDGSDRREFGGVGLGLAIVKELIGIMGGQIRVESAIDMGSRFSVEAPMAIAGDGAVYWPKVHGPVAKSVLQLGRSSGNATTLREYLLLSGVHVVTFATEEEARDARFAREVEGAEIVIADPVGLRDTQAFLDWVRCLPRKPRVFLAGSLAEVRLVPEHLRSRFNGVLHWPATPQSLERLRIATVQEPVVREMARRDLVALVVDDNGVNRKVAAALLTKLGVAVELAANGQEAVEMCRQRSYAVVLMDCQMPVMDGMEATRQIRSLTGESARVPIYGVSANSLVEVSQRCMTVGMDGFIAKPVTLARLEELLREATS